MVTNNQGSNIFIFVITTKIKIKNDRKFEIYELTTGNKLLNLHKKRRHQ